MLKPDLFSCVVLCCVVFCVCVVLCCEVCCVKVWVLCRWCSRFSWVRPKFGWTPSTGPPSRRGFTRQPENSKCTFQGHGLQKQIPRKDAKEREERKKIVAREGRKARNFGLPTLLGSTFFGVWAPTLKGLRPSGHHSSAPPSADALASSGIGLKRCWPEQVKWAGLKRFGLALTSKKTEIHHGTRQLQQAGGHSFCNCARETPCETPGSVRHVSSTKGSRFERAL